MRLRSFFAAPKDHKVTERYLHRVLISSICSIFLCLNCLAGVTWAWFAVSVENTGNEIWIGEPAITLKVDDAAFTSGSGLPAAEKEYLVQLKHANEPDDLDKKSTLYVTFTITGDGESIIRYTTLNEANGYYTEFGIQAEVACKLSWVVSWFPPDNAEELTEETLVVEAPPEPTTEPTTEPSTEATDETTEPSTEATDPSGDEGTSTPGDEETNTPGDEGTNTPGDEGTNTPEDEGTNTPEGGETNTPEGEETDTFEGGESVSSENETT